MNKLINTVNSLLKSAKYTVSLIFQPCLSIKEDFLRILAVAFQCLTSLLRHYVVVHAKLHTCICIFLGPIQHFV